MIVKINIHNQFSNKKNQNPITKTMNKKLHNKKHLYRKILICIIQIILSNNVFCQNIETIIKSKPITISGNVNFNTNADFLEDSINSYYYLSGGLNTTFFGIINV